MAKKTQNARKFKIKFKQRRVTLKCSIDKRTILLQSLLISPTKSYYWNVFLPICNNVLEQNCLEKPVFNKVSGLNHSSLENNIVTYKIKHFPQLFALGPQIALK